MDDKRWPQRDVDIVGLGSLHLYVLVAQGNLLVTTAAAGIVAQDNLSARVGVLMEGHTLRVGLLADLRVQGEVAQKGLHSQKVEGFEEDHIQTQKVGHQKEARNQWEEGCHSQIRVLGSQ